MMNIFKKAGYRIYQGIFYVAIQLLRIPLPTKRAGEGCSLQLIDDLKEHNCMKPLFFIEQRLVDLGLGKPLEEAFKKNSIEFAYFTHIEPNPTVALVEEAKQAYLDAGCDCMIALGGGSTMDLAKGCGVVLAYPGRSINDFEGVLKVHRKIPLLFAIPTTAGTGSETTLAAVIVDEKTHHKYQVDAPCLIPSYAYLDGQYLKSLPPAVIAMTGMDALTHAIEAYIGRSNTKFTRGCAERAFRLFKQHFLTFYHHPDNDDARNGMLEASYEAGNAFTRAYVGYVHALAHALGGYYHVAHGLANAILLPYVIRAYSSKLNKKAAEILNMLEVEIGEKEPYEALASYIDQINEEVKIPKHFDLDISDESYVELSAHAVKEGNPLYPVPILFDQEQMEDILREANKHDHP